MLQKPWTVAAMYADRHNYRHQMWMARKEQNPGWRFHQPSPKVSLEKATSIKCSKNPFYLFLSIPYRDDFSNGWILGFWEHNDPEIWLPLLAMTDMVELKQLVVTALNCAMLAGTATG